MCTLQASSSSGPCPPSEMKAGGAASVWDIVVTLVEGKRPHKGLASPGRHTCLFCSQPNSLPFVLIMQPIQVLCCQEGQSFQVPRKGDSQNIWNITLMITIPVSKSCARCVPTVEWEGRNNNSTFQDSRTDDRT